MANSVGPGDRVEATADRERTTVKRMHVVPPDEAPTEPYLPVDDDSDDGDEAA